MLRITTTATRDAYVAKLQLYYDQFGACCWHIIYAADIQARKYHLERLRRDLAHDHAMASRTGRYVEFDPSMPWEHAFRALLKDATFWQDYVVLPCQKLLRELPHKNSQPSVPGNSIDPNVTRQLKNLVTEVNALKHKGPAPSAPPGLPAGGGFHRGTSHT